VAGRILSCRLQRREDPAGLSEAETSLLQSLRAAVHTEEEAGEDGDLVRTAAVDAVSTIAASGEDGALCTMSRGLLLLRPIAAAAFTAPQSSMQERRQISALHCLASVARSARPEAATWLEEDLRDAFHDSIHQDSTCAEAIWRLLQRSGISFLELRIAVYRLLSGLCQRGWLAEEVCSHEALLTWLLSPEAEPSSDGLLGLLDSPGTPPLDQPVPRAAMGRSL
ncbi:hypothetical protein CYMTET_35834, partial [Cymbomonas tetramitiformis]